MSEREFKYKIATTAELLSLNSLKAAPIATLGRAQHEGENYSS